MSGLGEEIGKLAEDAVPGVLEAKVGMKAAKVIVIAVVGTLAAVGLAWWLWVNFLGPREAVKKSEQVEAQGRSAISDAGAKSGADAIKIIVDNGKAAADIDAAVRNAINDIHKAKGSEEPVDPAVDAAGRRAICLRLSASSLPECEPLLRPTP